MKKNLTIVFFLLAFVLTASIDASAQRKTIILVRHAEKADDPNKTGDPALSDAGRDRAQRLKKRIGGLRPGAFYSTEYKRTRETLEPLAAKRGKKVESYDARKAKELVDTIMASKTKRIVVSGHSNTIPSLVNEIMKKKLFRDLEDTEYATIWVIRLRDGKVTSAEILDY